MGELVEERRSSSSDIGYWRAVGDAADDGNLEEYMVA
jgi:hypothetical protein